MNIIVKILPRLAMLHPKNKGKKYYPQLWYCMPKRWKGSKGGRNHYRTKVSLFLQWLCKLLTGHELSETEWGYSGGNFIIRNCRWCDEYIKVPKNEEPKKREELGGMWYEQEENN